MAEGTCVTCVSRTVIHDANIMYDMCEQPNTRCPTHGQEFWKQIYREANAYADELTHHAREGS
eukprot:3108796-Pyramimonas_sp.AAC.1